MKKGFTLVELLVVIAIIAILAAILFPVFASMRNRAGQTSCLSNLKQLAVAAMTYCGDWGDWPTTGWTPKAYVAMEDIIVPRAVGGSFLSTMPKCATGAGYGFNYRLTPNFRANEKAEYVASMVSSDETEVVMFGETHAGHYIVDRGKFSKGGIHTGGVNIAFMDGHAKWQNSADFTKHGKFVLAGLVPPGTSPISSP